MAKFVVDFSDPEFATAVNVAVKEHIQKITAQEVEKLVKEVIEKKFHRIDNKKIESVLQSAIEAKIAKYFEERAWTNLPSDFGKVLERVLREMIEVKKR
jgi:hypothetical protein